MAPNKMLAAQLANELARCCFAHAVEYFVSYYDYYQPEAYIARRPTLIERIAPSTTTSGTRDLGAAVAS